jgi:hypothetical protein
MTFDSVNLKIIDSIIEKWQHREYADDYFSKNSKKRLDNVIDDIKKTSYQNDASVFNKFANTLYKGRNLELAQKTNICRKAIRKY